MKPSIDAGSLRDALEVLEFTETAPGIWNWKSVRKTRGQVKLNTTKKNIFSSVGLGARGAEILLRRQPLTLHQALRWGEQHLFLTAILPNGRLHLGVSGAIVQVDTVKLRGDGSQADRTFPGVLTEKYARHDQQWPMSINELGFVLVVPKPIRLFPGDLVEVRRAAWEVLVPHELDAFKNEYEIGRRVDL